MHGHLTKFHRLSPLGRFRTQLQLNAMSRQGIQSDEQSDYVQDVYVYYYLVNAATMFARLAGRDGGSHNSVQDVTVGFGPDRPRMNVYGLA